MKYGLPDWMFAAFAIGGWEVFDLAARRLHNSNLRYIGGAIVAVCALVLLIRYVVRYIRRLKNPPVHDPDEWKKY